MELAVRARTSADFPQLVELLRSSFEHDAYPTRWPVDPEAFLAPANTLAAWVATPAEHPAQVLGHLVVVPMIDESSQSTGLEISRLVTSRAFRGFGIGSRLLIGAQRWAEERGEDVYLQVVEGSSAVAFYEARGWTYIDTVDAYWVLDDGTRPRLRRYRAPLVSAMIQKQR